MVDPGYRCIGGIRKSMDDQVPQDFEDLGNGNEDRNAPQSDLAHNFMGVDAGNEHYGKPE